MNRIMNHLLLTCLLMTYGICLLLWMGADEVDTSEIRLITIVSVVWFGFLLLMGLKDIQTYFLLAPVVIMFIPNAVNDVFPEVRITENSDRVTVFAAIFTHIDFYFLAGILKFGIKSSIREKFGTPGIKVVLFFYCMLIPFLYFAQEKPGLAMGLSQVRYGLACILLFNLVKAEQYFVWFIKGCVLGLFGVLLESFVYTKTSGLTRLSSGNFAVNGLGHLFSALSIFIYFGLEDCKDVISRWMRVIAPLAAIIALLLTGTRSALVALAGAGLLCAFVSKRRGIILPIFLILAVAGFVLLADKIEAISRLASVADKLFSGNLEIADGTYSEDTTSLATRFVIWTGSIKMIIDHPILGIGPGVWNSIKSSYGVWFGVLLDPHNEYLAILTSYGLLFGAAVIGACLIGPIIMGMKRFNLPVPFYRSMLRSCLWFILSVSISGLFNASLLKHQMSAIFIMILLFFYKCKSKHDQMVNMGIARV